MLKTPQPRHRFQRIHRQLRQTGTYSADDPVEEALVRFLLKDDSVPEPVIKACKVFWDGYKREVVEAFLLAEAGPKDLYEVFKIDTEVVELYEKLFFDISVFDDRLDAESYARNYEEDDFGRELKISAIEDGLEYLKARFGRGNYDVSPTKAIKESISLSYVNSKVASKVSIDSPKAKEARKWASSMVKNIEALDTAQKIEGNKNADYMLKLKIMSDKEGSSENEEIDIDPEDIVTQNKEERT